MHWTDETISKEKLFGLAFWAENEFLKDLSNFFGGDTSRKKTKR